MLRIYMHFLLAVVIPWSIFAKMRPYKHIGCFRDDTKRALSEFIGYMYSTAKIKECATKVNEKGYQVFALQIGYECFSGPGADKTYNKYDSSTACSSGLGGRWANDVYQFSDELLWPAGSFSLLKPSSGCPQDFIYNGWLLQDTADNIENDRSAVLSIDGFVNKGYVVRSFCTKTRRTSPEWPKGKYCIYKDYKNNVKYGRIRMDNASPNKDSVDMIYSNAITKYNGYSYLYVNLYCETTGNKSVPIDLPISHPFYLLPYGSSDCQQVKWMVATKEWIRYATSNYNTQSNWRTGSVPYIKAGPSTHRGVTMFYCLYTSCNRTLNATQGVVQTPGFPKNYPNGQLCSWKILVPENHTVFVRFTKFFLDNVNIKATDVLELHRLSNGTFILNASYTGNLEPFQVTSTSDVLFVFRSNYVNSSHGFYAEYKVFVPEISTPPTTELPITTRAHAPKTALWETTTQEPTNVLRETNKTKRESLKGNSKETGTIILIVIPLICFILIVVVSIDIYCRCRSKVAAKYKHESSRTDSDDRVAVNPTYESSAGMQMSHVNSTTTVNTIVDHDNKPQNTEEGYERLSRISPRREVHEDYEELNRTSCPSTRDSKLQDEAPGSFYHVLERPTDGKGASDDQMYQTVDNGSCSNGLYARNTLYDSVA